LGLIKILIKINVLMRKNIKNVKKIIKKSKKLIENQKNIGKTYFWSQYLLKTSFLFAEG